MKSHPSKIRRRHRSAGSAQPRKASPTAKLLNLPEDQVAQIVAWLFQGETYGKISSLAKQHFGVTCSKMAVKTVWDKFARAEEQMRAERIVRRARVLASMPQAS